MGLSGRGWAGRLDAAHGAHERALVQLTGWQRPMHPGPLQIHSCAQHAPHAACLEDTLTPPKSPSMSRKTSWSSGSNARMLDSNSSGRASMPHGREEPISRGQPSAGPACLRQHGAALAFSKVLCRAMWPIFAMPATAMIEHATTRPAATAAGSDGSGEGRRANAPLRPAIRTQPRLIAVAWTRAALERTGPAEAS